MRVLSEDALWECTVGHVGCRTRPPERPLLGHLCVGAGSPGGGGADSTLSSWACPDGTPVGSGQLWSPRAGHTRLGQRLPPRCSALCQSLCLVS